MAYFITDTCVGCTLCEKTCPVGAISGDLKQRHIIDPERCVDCGACGRVCGVGAVRNAQGEPAVKLPRAQWARPVVDTARCSACSMCVQICGKDALSISLPTFRGDIAVFAQLTDGNACVACGLCERVCPLHAITMRKAVEA